MTGTKEEEWCQSMRRMQVLSEKIEAYGIIRLGLSALSQVYRSGTGRGSPHFADAFYNFRRFNPNAKVEILDTAPDPTFLVQLPDSSPEPIGTDGEMARRIHPSNVYWVCLQSKQRVCNGGYILLEGLQFFAESLLAAERGETPTNYSNSVFLRYPRDANQLQEQGRPIDPPIGREVMVLQLIDCNEAVHYRVFTVDTEEIFPFEVAPDLISYQRWGMRVPLIR